MPEPTAWMEIIVSRRRRIRVELWIDWDKREYKWQWQ